MFGACWAKFKQLIYLGYKHIEIVGIYLTYLWHCEIILCFSSLIGKGFNFYNILYVVIHLLMKQ